MTALSSESLFQPVSRLTQVRLSSFLIVKAYHAVLFILQLFNLGPSYTIPRFFIKSHRTRHAFKLDIGNLLQNDVGNLFVVVVVVIQTLTGRFQSSNGPVQG